jgi:hypothetical protein
MKKASTNKSCPTDRLQKNQNQPDWLTTVEILKDQAKISFFFAIKMSEEEILVDNLVDPDSAIEHYINLSIGGIKELTSKLAKLGMPNNCIEDVKAYHYMNISKDNIIDRLSSRAKHKRDRKLLIRELRDALLHSEDDGDRGTEMENTHEYV